MAESNAKIINVRYINNDGAGFAKNCGIRKGTTVSEFLQEQLGSDANLDNTMIRVDNLPAAEDDVLEPDQTVVATPTNIEGGLG